MNIKYILTHLYTYRQNLLDVYIYWDILMIENTFPLFDISAQKKPKQKCPFIILIMIITEMIIIKNTTYAHQNIPFRYLCLLGLLMLTHGYWYHCEAYQFAPVSCRIVLIVCAWIILLGGNLVHLGYAWTTFARYCNIGKAKMKFRQCKIIQTNSRWSGSVNRSIHQLIKHQVDQETFLTQPPGNKKLLSNFY